ncbi:MAG: CHAT domain-containing protein [Hyphomicrobiales bacterium]
MIPTIQIIGTRIDLSGDFGTSEIRLTDECKVLFADWKARYQSLNGVDAQNELRALGSEMFKWLNQTGWGTKWLEQSDIRQLEIGASSPVSDDEFYLLDLPWEVLADKSGFLAEDSIQTYEVWRRVGTASTPAVPEHKDLSLLFMAASPRGVQPELNFDDEEAAILKATASLDLALFVEESGCPSELRQRTLQQEKFDAFHFSCHGDLLDADDAKRFAQFGAQIGPNLLMEDEFGDRLFVPPSRLAEIWEGDAPSLVFLSACKTSEHSMDVQDAFTVQIARAVPAVIGWGGSVYDPDATKFASEFYKQLAGFKSVTFAVARARRELLLNSTDLPTKGAHWHLARLWLGRQGGGPICRRDGNARRLPKNVGYKSFLDKRRERGKVASQLAFVGRRREAQDILRALKRLDGFAVALLGLGNMGKSSLAARVANRLPSLTTVVVVDDYDRRSVFQTLIDELPPQQRKSVTDEWLDRVKNDQGQFADAVESLLGDHFYDNPILLVVDDLEQVLHDPTKDEERCGIKQDNGWSDTIVSLLKVFKKAGGKSKLLFTCRYDFSAIGHDGIDLSREVDFIHLIPFSPRDREKQWRAEQNLRLLSEDQTIRVAAQNAIDSDDYQDLRTSAIQIAEGNPGLQDLFARPLLSADFGPVRSAMRDIQVFLANPNDLPEEENAAFEFLRRMTFDKYRDALNPSETAFLKAATLFGEGVWPKSSIAQIALAALDRYQSTPVPVPSATLQAVGNASGVTSGQKAQQRIAGLGLLDVYSASVTGREETGFLVNQFARPLIPVLTEKERRMLADAALPSLENVWSDEGGNWPKDERSVETLRLAFLKGEV